MSSKTYKIQGQQARDNGIPFDANPYPKGTSPHVLWGSGWKIADVIWQREDAYAAQSRADIGGCSEEHYQRYKDVADTLNRLGICATDLRDYLAGLLD